MGTASRTRVVLPGADRRLAELRHKRWRETSSSDWPSGTSWGMRHVRHHGARREIASTDKAEAIPTRVWCTWAETCSRMNPLSVKEVMGLPSAMTERHRTEVSEGLPRAIIEEDTPAREQVARYRAPGNGSNTLRNLS